MPMAVWRARVGSAVDMPPRLDIKGKRQEGRGASKKDYYLHERSFGSFERYFAVPEGVDADRIEANFQEGR